MLPPVTCLIPAYNAERLLPRALASVRGQTLAPAEILVIDDGSTDGTAAVSAAFGARLVQHPGNRGLSAALNTGLAAASHDLVALLDADDEWLPEKLARQLPAFLAAEVLLSATASRWIGSGGEDFGVLGDEPPPHQGAEFWRSQFQRARIAQPTVLARRQTFIDLGGFDESLRTGMDQDMWMRVALAGPVQLLPEALTRVHLNHGSMTHKLGTRSLDAELAFVEKFRAAIIARLGVREGERLCADRRARIGKDLCAMGGWRRGAPLLLRAAALNIRPAQQLHHLLTTLPPLRPVKRLVARVAG